MGQNATDVEGSTSVNQVYPISRITGEGREECLSVWGPGFKPEGPGGHGGTAGATQTVRGNSKSLTGTNVTFCFSLSSGGWGKIKL